MKTYEIHANIERFKNKNTRFKLISSPRTIRTATNEVVPNGSVVQIGSFGLDGNAFYDLSFNRVLIESNNAFAEWEEVKEPVTWMEAIQAWIDGETIYCISGTSGQTYRYKGDCLMLVSGANEAAYRSEFKNGKWYID